ncbi:MAG: polyphosphate polymerase domain-containing protein [Fibrobacter sp.]|nr:polyphosphate polymerase domain-containing protein [Fibrobacter sp.]
MANEELSTTTIEKPAESQSGSVSGKENKPRGVKEFSTPSTLERFELKYTIPSFLVDPIVDFIKPYCSYDSFSLKSVTTDNYYKVNSLYFDTPEFLFIKKRITRAENRFNMRIRSYGDNPVPPYFLEIKQRRGDTIRKFRAKCEDTFIQELSTSALKPMHFSSIEKERKNQELFFNLMQTYCANPVVLVQYMRKAFVSDVDDYARVTFDRALRYMPQTAFNIFPVEQSMCPSDFQTNYDDGCSIILELKCYTSYVPLWMIDLVRKFQLRRRGFSKYSNCLRPVFDRYAVAKEIFGRVPTIEFN